MLFSFVNVRIDFHNRTPPTFPPALKSKLTEAKLGRLFRCLLPHLNFK